MRYESFKYRWSPRPGSKSNVPAAILPKHEADGWWAQIKKNGTCNVMAIDPDRRIIARTRHGDTPHKNWTPTEDTRRAFLNLPGNGWYVTTSELMHSKVPGIRSVNYIHDILVVDGEDLVGETFEARQALLLRLFTPVGETFSHYIIDDNTWLAKNHQTGFFPLFRSLEGRESQSGLENRGNEGLVLKRPQAPLRMCLNDKANAGWQKKCRRPTKVIPF